MSSTITSAVRGAYRIGALNVAPRRHKLCNARLSVPNRFEKLCGAVNH